VKRKPPTVNRAAIAASFACVLAVAACSHTSNEPIAGLRVNEARLEQIKTLAVLPLEYAPGIKETCLLTEALAAAFAERYNVVIVQPPAYGVVQEPKPSFLEVLLAARRDYGADAVLQGRVLYYRRFDPPVATLTLRMVSTHDAAVLWAVSGELDAAEPRVKEQAQLFYDRRHAAEPDRQPAIVPERLFAQFVADQFLLAMNLQSD